MKKTPLHAATDQRQHPLKSLRQRSVAERHDRIERWDSSTTKDCIGYLKVKRLCEGVTGLQKA
eukprot:scaffold561659_cov29-Prasinocladus_malaysianus.AAC.1